RITAETQKLDTLKAHKKGLMQQLFPAEGETLPKLRFPEFSEKWREISLGGISDSISSGKDKNDSDGKYDLYGSTGIIGKTLSDTYKGKFLLVARVGANAGFLTMTNGTFGVTDNTLVVCLKKIVNLDFIYYYLESLSLNKLVFGSGQPLSTGGQLKALHLFLPDYPEQQKIAGCLTSIDEAIAAQSQAIDLLKLHKKGLMQQLFPSVEEVRG
ncbi:MAG: restriction endonuclease subunit S, partial [Pseudanabaena sp.]